MDKLSIQEIHSELLNMLQDIIKICEKNKITYYLSGGTLLGAVRHKGFIPWDDDIDIMIPRKDYKKFESMYRETGSYLFWSKKDRKKWNAPYNRVVNSNTFVNNKNSEMTHGLFIDIFPIDYAPKNKWLRKTVVSTAKLLDTLRNGARRKDYTEDEGFLLLKKYFINPLGKIIGSYNCSYLIDKFAETVGRLSNKSPKYCGVIVVSYHYKMREFVPVSIYNGDEKLLFEKIEVKVPEGYDIYLSSLYGDYMELPSKENQIAGHYPVYWME